MIPPKGGGPGGGGGPPGGRGGGGGGSIPPGRGGGGGGGRRDPGREEGKGPPGAPGEGPPGIEAQTALCKDKNRKRSMEEVNSVDDFESLALCLKLQRNSENVGSTGQQGLRPSRPWWTLLGGSLVFGALVLVCKAFTHLSLLNHHPVWLSGNQFLF